MTTPPAFRVLVLSTPASRGHALNRLSELTARAWRDTGATVIAVEAPDSLPRRLFAATPGMASAESSWLARTLRREDHIDLVHVIDPADAPAAVRLPGAPRVLVTVHEMPALHHEDDTRRRQGRGRSAVLLRALSDADLVVATSRHVADALAPALNRAVPVLHPPVEPTATDRRSSEESFRPPAWPYLLTVADAGPRGGRAEAIHAWAQLRRTPHLDGLSLVVVGEPLTALEESQVTACGGHASVFTDVSALQLSALHSRARAVLALGRPRSLPMTVLEAHQAGRPVLAIDHDLFIEAGGQGCVYVPAEGVTQFDARTWNSIAEDLASPVVADRADLNANGHSWMAYVDGLQALARGDEVAESTPLGHVDLRDLDALLESSPWAAPPLSLAQLSTPMPLAPWAMPPELQELDDADADHLDIDSTEPTDLTDLSVEQQLRPRSTEAPILPKARKPYQDSTPTPPLGPLDESADTTSIFARPPGRKRSALPDLGLDDDVR